MVLAVIVFISALCRQNQELDKPVAVGEPWPYATVTLQDSFLIEQVIPVNRVFSKNMEDEQFLQRGLNELINNVSENGNSPQLLQELKQKVGTFFSKGIYNKTDFLGIDETSIYVTAQDSLQRTQINDLISVAEAKNDLISWVGKNLPGLQYDLERLLSARIVPNIAPYRSISPKVLEQYKEPIIYQSGYQVIQEGERLTTSNKDMLDKVRKSGLQFGQEQNEFSLLTFLGYLLLVFLTVGTLLLYIKFNHPHIFEKYNYLGFVLIWLVIFSFLVFIIERTPNLSSYLIPFCIVPIIVKNFFDERLALFIHIVVVLIASIISKLGYEFTFLQILAGIVTVLTVAETRYWNEFFRAIFIIFLTYVVGYLGLSLIHSDSFATIDWKPFAWLGLGTMFTLLAYPFIPLIEKVFGFTSSISLAELADMNSPLIKELSLKAPGTLQHSLQVSNLAEAAVDKIGGNSLLVKVAALYHDIGKLSDPEIFIENQSNRNPHNELTYFQSANKIIDHVIEGGKMAKKARLPQVIIDFIMSHHGTTRVEYFYRNQLKDFPDKEFDEALFRYPGPKPVTKEETILMIADSLEAASKSLKNPTGKDIDELIQKIIAHKIDQGQLDDSKLSFRELEECQEVFKALLRSINHVRVEYPEEPR